MTLPSGRDALEGLDLDSFAHQALAALLAHRERVRTSPRGRSRSDIEASLERPIDVIAIRCSGHAVNGQVKKPRVGYAVRVDVERGWYFGGTLSAALEMDDWPSANAARTESVRQTSSHERDVVACSDCLDRFVFANGPRIATALVSFLDEGKHTVTIAELRERY